MTVTDPLVDDQPTKTTGRKPFPNATSPEIVAEVLRMSQSGMYTLGQIADKTGVSAHTVSRLEHKNGLGRRKTRSRRSGSVQSFDMNSLGDVRAAIVYHERQLSNAHAQLSVVIQSEIDALQGKIEDLAKQQSTL